ncbi:DNA topoisomerase IB [Flavobacterium silvaticum]|uniref:DNA topoisomerase n=1 Tax=Flavobacterium silvaticum TaxID=1852020 RepID=A0A972JIK8_9FLAO|nr:DNA topoisomerase IB [Flavobacterium silvaticum]NMH29145.1 DNA topoisomerase IB [Flavobacterium silvaticum]
MNRLQAKLEKIGRDPVSTAKAAGLRYYESSRDGIYRVGEQGKFHYKDEDGNKITNREDLERIASLVIPPAWKNVWIAPKANAHLQVTGFDARGRKQYRYHPDWNKLRNQSKFFRLRDFAKALPSIRKQVSKDLNRKGLPAEKVKALVVQLLEHTNIRIGNDAYSKLYGSFGLTTLRDRHVSGGNNQLFFEFIGKKGIRHKIALKSPRLIRLVRKCREIPGQELFQYLDHDGNRHSLNSGDVNDYIKSLSGHDFTAKDFRCWFGSVLALERFQQIGPAESESILKKNINQVIDDVAAILGNTRTVCKKYYVHPTVISAYEKNHIGKYYVPQSRSHSGLTPEETALVKLLNKEAIATAL